MPQLTEIPKPRETVGESSTTSKTDQRSLQQQLLQSDQPPPNMERRSHLESSKPTSNVEAPNLLREMLKEQERADLRNKTIMNGADKLRQIEQQKPKNDHERLISNQVILSKYAERYETQVTFEGFDAKNHTIWKVGSMIKGTRSFPYWNRLTPETGTFYGDSNYRTMDMQRNVPGTEALHFSDIIYCQIETSRRLIQDASKHLPQLTQHSIPEFSLQKYVGAKIGNRESSMIIDAFLSNHDSRQYAAGSPEFNAFAGVPTTASKLRLAHRYNKKCVLIRISGGKGGYSEPMTEHKYRE